MIDTSQTASKAVLPKLYNLPTLDKLKKQTKKLLHNVRMQKKSSKYMEIPVMVLILLVINVSI